MRGDLPLILLSGGKGSRVGRSKGLVTVGGRPWLELQLEAFARAGGKRAVVILGYQAQDYMQAMPWLREPLSDPGHETGAFGGLAISAAVNGNPEFGPFSSIQLGGFLLAGADHPAAFILPVDVPFPSPEVCSLLDAQLNEEISAVVPTHEARGGHPVLVSKKLLESFVMLDAHSPEARMDRQLKRLSPEALVRVEVADSKVTMNLNALEDWKALFPN